MTFEDGQAHEDARKEHAISSRAASLWKLTESCESNVAKYLLLSTAGGAVATLSFMGTASELRALWGPRIALCSFLLGVLACGVMLAARALNASGEYVQFLKNIDEFRKSDISWDELSARSSPNYGARLGQWMAIITYLCLVMGAAAGAFTVWTRAS